MITKFPVYCKDDALIDADNKVIGKFSKVLSENFKQRIVDLLNDNDACPLDNALIDRIFATNILYKRHRILDFMKLYHLYGQELKLILYHSKMAQAHI